MSILLFFEICDYVTCHPWQPFVKEPLQLFRAPKTSSQNRVKVIICANKNVTTTTSVSLSENLTAKSAEVSV